MHNQNKTLVRITLFAIFLALVVVTLGAYTRLTDAGLGCPDWPGCYNQLLAPHNQQEIRAAAQSFPQSPVHVAKAWTEMVHRYAAMLLGLTIVSILGAVLFQRRRYSKDKFPLSVPLILLVLTLFQSLLGKWTVTMKLLPIVVMAHLLGGLSIVALLWWIHLRARDTQLSYQVENAKSYKPWAILGLLIVILQIALGGWTSANYAALVCPDFPYCIDHTFFPATNFQHAFYLFYEGPGQISHTALITIQMMHRLGALVTTIYIGILSFCLMLREKSSQQLRFLGVVMFLILVAQIVLGSLNVTLLLPLPIAVLHNAMAVFLLLSLVYFVYITFCQTERIYE